MRNTPNAKVHGHIKGIPVGMHFYNREDLAKAGVHGRPRWGIHGTAKDGAYAIALNDGYEDDDDQGETIFYTGQGKGKQRLGRVRGSSQVGDQKWTHGNKALVTSYNHGYPVRVIRGPNGNEKYCPYEGFRYDGLYLVVGLMNDRGKKGFGICRFELRRLKEQDPLPGPCTSSLFWKPDAIRPEERLTKHQLSTPTSLSEKSEIRRKLQHLGRIPKVQTNTLDSPESNVPLNSLCNAPSSIMFTS